MAKDVIKEKTKEPNNLPSYTNIDNIILLLDAYKKKNGDEETSKQVFGKGTSAYSNTKSALRIFGFIEEGSCSFLPLGRFVAFSKDEERKEHVKRAILSFTPYETLLINLFQRKPPVETTIDEITNFWGRFDQGTTNRNMIEAATLFMGIMDYLGFGKYTIGRGGKATRFIWAADADQKVKAALETPQPQELNEAENKNTTPPQENGKQAETLAEKIIDTANCEPMDTLIHKVTVKSTIIPNITVNVDMTSWSEEKIKQFFKYAYGQFEEEQEKNA